jgi:hypothetical protein
MSASIPLFFQMNKDERGGGYDVKRNLTIYVTHQLFIGQQIRRGCTQLEETRIWCINLLEYMR